MKTVTFAYLNSLDWKVFEENNEIWFTTEDKEREYDLYTTTQTKGFFNKIKVVYLVVTDKKSGVMIYKSTEKIVQLWNNLVKDIECIKEKLIKEIEI